MLIDHIGFFLFPEQNIWRIIGRLAFPIFAYMIANGYQHTSDPKKYFLRLALFGIGFQWFFAKMVNPQLLNIFITLALGLAAIWLADTLQKKINNRYLGQILGLIIAASIAWLADWLNVDYNWYSVALIYTAWLFYQRLAFMSLSWVVINIGYAIANGGAGISIQIFSLLALIVIGFYNHRPGKSNRWFFYVFYPLHLGLLFLLAQWLG